MSELMADLKGTTSFNQADLQAVSSDSTYVLRSIGMSSRDLNKKVRQYKVLLALHVPPRGRHLDNLGTALQKRFQQHGDTKDLDEAIELHKKALAAHKPPHPNRSRSLHNLAYAVQTRFKQQGDARDINEAIQLNREALALREPPHPDRGKSLNNLANAVWIRFEHRGDTRDINEAIELHKKALTLHEPPHPNHSISLNNLAIVILTRFEQQGDARDIDEAIQLHREALALCGPPHPDRGMSLNNLANAILTRFGHQGDTRDINEAIQLNKEALTLYESPHPNRSSSLNNLANAVQARFEHQGDTRDIDEAIHLNREALALREPPHPDRGMSLNNLANAVWTRFEQQGDTRDLNEAIQLNREALTLFKPPHLNRSSSLNNLANAVQARFQQQGDRRDIDEAIDLHREALSLHEPPHPNRSQSLHNLALAILTRFEQQGDTRDIDEAIQLHREALALREPPHPDRGMSLTNLANAVWTKFEHQGDIRNIDEAIQLDREALTLYEPPHPNHSSSLNNLANAVQARFEHQGDTRDIDEAIHLNREALALREPPHPNRSSSLNNLANAVWTRFEHQGDRRDIDEAIQLNREALALHKPPHPNRSSSLNNLAVAILTRFEQHGDARDIDEAIQLNREALALCEPPHPYRGMSVNNLANAVSARFEHQGETRDINEAIELRREALALHKPPHPNRSSLLQSLAKCLVFIYERVQDSHDLDIACHLFQEAVTYPSSSPSTRFHHACSWAKSMVQYNPTSSLAAYCAAVELLPQLAALHLDLPTRQRILFSTANITLASDAATCAVGLDQYNTAVELLEASRFIFWSQALHLRTPLDDLATIRPDLSAKLTDFAWQLEQASFRDTSRNISTDTQQRIRSIESEGARCRQLNEDWEQTIKKVQKLPGFEDFMRPKAITALRKAAVSGPIIILTTTNSTCFALTVTLSSEVQYLKLPEFILPEVHILAELSRGLSNPAFDFDTFVENHEHGNHRSELEARLLAGREGTVKMDPDEKSVDPPRLWWCPTGPFAFLPIHAAGIYDKDMTDCVSDYVIPSYTPTLTALLDPPPVTATQFQMTTVIEPKAPNCPPLPGAMAELNKIMTRVPDQWLTGLVNTTAETALIHLHASSIVHFACHGVQDLEHPLDSGLILTDGRLKVSKIMHRPEGGNPLSLKKPMSLAFLSACETAKGDKTVPDEAMHLAATLLFAGFRGVIATMCSLHARIMNDLDGPKIADTFYEHLFKNCDPISNPPVLPDLTQAAKALHLAVAKLRNESDIPFKRWVPFESTEQSAEFSNKEGNKKASVKARNMGLKGVEITGLGGAPRRMCMSTQND
ncbi:CHAT domain-containing protein [Mycena galopus ATCC 62051]|nr:CHAT domain-containing protein [Mycena galopus ATCC 62051]